MPTRVMIYKFAWAFGRFEEKNVACSFVQFQEILMIPVFQQAFLKGRGTQFLGVLYVFIAKGRGGERGEQPLFLACWNTACNLLSDRECFVSNSKDLLFILI
jgi:hypothetical protein